MAIEKSNWMPDECLNDKFELGKTMIPELKVYNQKGIISMKKLERNSQTLEHLAIIREAMKKGTKRISYHTSTEEDSGEKNQSTIKRCCKSWK